MCVPQVRERVILVGALKSFKQKSHSPLIFYILICLSLFIAFC
ncbi:DNA cytosine methyltransferase [Helicobacter pylori]|nr:DNA cytosine methyltransferase [Helicobacter pylori]